MQVVLHIGMHKTGSSSIQETFARILVPPAVYFLPKMPNHSGILSQGYETDPRLRRQFHPHTREVEQKARNQVLNGLRVACKSPGAEKVIISGERLCVMSPDALRSLKADLDTLFSSVHVIGYVRPLAGLMASAFQQILKHGYADFDRGAEPPQYRPRFEKFDEIFGRENVELVYFDRKHLTGGDAVIDFASRIGVEIAADDITSVNESLPLEGTALLYAHRKYVVGASGERSNNVARDARLIDLCRQIGTGKFAFGPDVAAHATVKNADDYAWIAQRISVPQEAFCTPGTRGINREAELLSLIEQPETAQQILALTGGATGAAAPSAKDLALALEGAR